MSRKSTALILVLVVMIIVGLGTTALLQAMISYANMRILSMDNIKAQYLAEAGMQYAVWQCRNGNYLSEKITIDGWPVVITKTPENGSYKIEVSVQYPGL